MTSDGPHAGHEPAEAAADPPKAGTGRASASVPVIRASASVPSAAPQTGASVSSAAPQNGAYGAPPPPDAYPPAAAGSPAAPTRPPSTPAVPAPRASDDPRPTFSATASVPAASRLRPGGEDTPAAPDGIPAPRPRVYGTPITPPGGPYPTVPAPRDIPPIFPPIAGGQAHAGPAGAMTRGSANPTAVSGVAAVRGIVAPQGPTRQPGTAVPPGSAVPPAAGAPPTGLLPDPAHPTGPSRPPGLPAYGDLLGLIPTSAAAPAPPTTRPNPNAPTSGGYPPVAPQVGHTEPGQTSAEARQPAGYGPPGAPALARPAQAERPDFEAFRLAAQQDQGPIPQVRSGRVLIAVIAAAVLLLVLPLGVVWLVTRPNFNVGQCVRQSGSAAVETTCQDARAYEIVSKVDGPQDCPDRNQPYAVLAGKSGKEQVLCLRPASNG